MQGAPAEQTLCVRRPGRVAYADALRWQQEAVLRRQEGKGEDVLFLLEHPRVITLGRNSHRAHLLLSEEVLRARGYEIHEVGRGGDVTYHGPGQLVGYPILALRSEERDAHAYLRKLEQVLIDTLSDLAVAARRHPPHTGVWVDGAEGPEKIAAIGVRLSKWVSSHGFALNLDCDLEDFHVIVPCGIREYRVTSVERVLGAAPPRAEVEDLVVGHFSRVFQRAVRDPGTADRDRHRAPVGGDH